MNANWISVILILLFLFYITYLVFMPYLGRVSASVAQMLSTSEQYIPTTAFACDSSGLVASFDLKNIYIPPKTIIMFHGAVIPSGWVECNGQNGTPNLSGRMPLAFNNSQNTLANRIGNTGGKYGVRLSVAEMPSHKHTGKTSEAGRNKDTRSSLCGAGTTPDDRDSHTHSFTTNATGGGGEHNNLPPYYAVRFIMKT